MEDASFVAARISELGWEVLVELQGKVALVTGGGTGLGCAISLALAGQGMAVAVNYSRSEAEARETVAELQARGARALAVQADVSAAETVRAMMARVVGEWGRLDVLVNNAGVTRYIPLDDLEAVRPEDFGQVFAVNFKGAFLCAQAAVPHLKAHGRGKTPWLCRYFAVSQWDHHAQRLEERLQLGGALPQHALVGDRVAPVHRLRLVADHLHGGRPGHTGALEVPLGRAPEAVGDPVGAPRPPCRRSATHDENT